MYLLMASLATFIFRGNLIPNIAKVKPRKHQPFPMKLQIASARVEADLMPTRTPWIARTRSRASRDLRIQKVA